LAVQPLTTGDWAGRRRSKRSGRQFEEITEHLQAEILRAQYKHEDKADRKRKPAPAFKVDDQVWFNA